MNRVSRVVWMAALWLCWMSLALAQAETTLSHGRFEQVRLYPPAGAVDNVVLQLSGDAGWTLQEQQRAATLASHKVLVTGVATPALLTRMATDKSDCAFPDGDLENLSRFVQAYLRLPGYHQPFLLGEGNSAAFAFATLSQAPARTFAGLLTQGFCPDWRSPVAVCAGEGLRARSAGQGQISLLPESRLTAPWLELPGPTDCPAAKTSGWQALATVPVPSQLSGDAWVPALAALSAAAPATTATAEAVSALQDLPLQEIIVQEVAVQEVAAPEKAVPNASATTPARDQFALFLSGDGGWAGLDEEVAVALAARQVPVVGWDSLRYYWMPRTPDGIAADAERIIRHYLQQWGRQRLILVGYSQGADVLPFLINRLPADLRARVSLVVLMGLSTTADFEFHLTNWVGSSNDGVPVLPEIARIQQQNVLCLYGEDEKDSGCPAIQQPGVQVVKLDGGHHFDGDYTALAQRILNAAP